ncbi:MAG: hypothetical protein MOGMAGMI_02186 [Candidatus Omnitrophica bacterium]|nr:hypothetical protein [Candidatus Omnitrophota bacterium]
MDPLLVYLVFVALVWCKRALWLSAIRRSDPPIRPVAAGPGSPRVSVIIPARNEERNIGRCLDSILVQDYPDYEVIVVDDRSGDRTPEILEDYRGRSGGRLRIVRVEQLPPGWTGKNHAMWVGSRAAASDWLLFTDADTRHDRLCLASAVTTALKGDIDFLTLAPETESVTFWEKTVQPLAVSSIALWFDPRKVNDPKSGVVIANGQFILVRRSVYEAVGGSQAVKDRVVEDVELARLVRGSGHAIKFLDGTLLYATRMYSSLAEIKTGWTRIFTHLFEKNVAALAHKIFLFLFFSIGPFAALAAAAARTAGSGVGSPELTLSAAVCALIVVIRAAGNLRVRTNPVYALLHPVGSAVMVWILGICVWRVLADRPSPWRGDQLR